MIFATNEFTAQLASILEINQAVVPELETEWEAIRPVLPDEAFPYLSKGERDDIKNGFRAFAAGLEQILEAHGASNSTDPDAAGAEFTVDLGATAGAALHEFILSASKRGQNGYRGELMRRSLLVSAISTFEVLFGRIARFIYEVNSSALNDSDYSFTLQQLSDFSSVEDARDYLIERRIAALMRESIDGWEKWLKRAGGGISMTGLPVDWTVVREAFARRNLVVHAGSVVNHLYLESIRGLGIKVDEDELKGKTLQVTGDYLNQCVESVLALGRILAVAVGQKIHKDSRDEHANSLRMEVWQCVRNNLWHAVQPLADYALSLDLRRGDQLEIQAAQWLARKNLHGIEEIRDEVTAWDTSGLSLKYAHHKDVLLGNSEEAAVQIEKLLESGSLNIFEVLSSPLYSDVRPAVLQRLDQDSSRWALTELLSDSIPKPDEGVNVAQNSSPAPEADPRDSGD
ncbi:hypothetical protein [Streptomyces goshikiensis]|uniref:hypothetical protein n=1 Tax=Streptomyces goshikiensis TaxID=1942 RepID=UPI0036CFBAD0